MNVAAEYLLHLRRADVASAVDRWAKKTAARDGSDSLIVNLRFKKLLLVNQRDVSDRILETPPGDGGYVEGAAKKKAMSFLAPRALTIEHGAEWKKLRGFNEHVLCTGAAHAHAQAFLGTVRDAFDRPVRDVKDIRRAMGAAMLGIVFGEGVAASDLGREVQALFAVVKSPLKRMLLRRLYVGRRERFYKTLRERWKEADRLPPSLIGLAREAGAGLSEDTLLQQIPHWMFTFTGSGTDLLYRTLAVVGSRTDVHQRVAEEVGVAGPFDDADAIERLRYVEACLLETGRLFPPVTLTFHVATKDDVLDGRFIPQGTEIIHYLPLLQRNRSEDPSTDTFRPQRWLTPSSDRRLLYSNLFLRGARACPGQDLILFVCKSALAIQVERYGVTCEANRLSTDPLPMSFPSKSIRFRARDRT